MKPWPWLALAALGALAVLHILTTEELPPDADAGAEELELSPDWDAAVEPAAPAAAPAVERSRSSKPKRGKSGKFAKSRAE